MTDLNLPNYLMHLDSYADVKTTLERWKAAHKSLIGTIQSYLAASSALSAACAESSVQASQSFLIEETLLIIGAELEALALEEDKLGRMRMSLTTMRNKSLTLVRINTLPTEILAYIFKLSNGCCIRDDSFTLHRILGVCVHWRQVAINTPDLWTHLDIRPNTPVNFVESMLQRTRDSSIHIHICEPVSKIPFTAFGHGGPAETTGLVQAIAPHTRRVHSLDVESSESSEEFVRAVMNLWLDDGSARLPRSVVVYQSEKARDLFFEGSINRAVASLEESREVLQSSPGILQLYNVYLSWDNLSYHGLAELELGFPERTLVTIPEPQLASILSASPALAVLKLDNLIVTPVEGWSGSTPIVLSCLKVLRVFLVSSQSTNLFLPLIRPSPTSPIQVSMAVTDFPEIYEEIRRFFADSCITALHCHALDTFDSAMSLLQLVFSSLYHLSTLVLTGFDLHHLAFQINQTFSQPTSFVCRPAVVLLACRVTFEGLNSLILRHGVRDLRLEHCRSIGPGVYRITLRSIQASLLEVYPDLRCSISDAMDSTSKLPCRTMLGRPAVWQSSQMVNRLMAGW